METPAGVPGLCAETPTLSTLLGHQSYRTSFVSVSGAESLISVRTRLWRAFRQSGQRQSGKRGGRDPLAERGRLVNSAKGTEREKAGTHSLNVGAS